MAPHPMLRSSRARFVLADLGVAATLALGLGLWSTPARAHIELLLPSARYTPDTQKSPPCGHPDNPPGDGSVTVFEPGETITIEFDEFVDHPGHFRIALDPTGTDAFTSPTDFDDFYNSPEVLLDDIADAAGGLYQIDVTLPDEPCNPCTLQLIQVMNDGAWGPGNSDLYFQCADIAIEPAGAGTGTGPDLTTGGNGETGADDSSGGGETGSPGDDSGNPGDDTDPGDGTGGVNPGSESTGPADSDEGGGCSCRAAHGRGDSAAPWLLLVLLGWPRRRPAKR